MFQVWYNLKTNHVIHKVFKLSIQNQNHHHITEILLKMALITINLPLKIKICLFLVGASDHSILIHDLHL
jgi:hypothetical protein